jgi:hypothetical protein
MIAEVAEIEARARLHGVPILRIVKGAGIAYSTWTRWKKEDTAPNTATLAKLRSALDAELA